MNILRWRPMVALSLLCVLTLPAAGVAVAATPGPASAPFGDSPGTTTGVAGPVAPQPVTPIHPFRWPVDGEPRLTRRFDPPPRPWLSGHRGVDLAVEPGGVVRAAGAGMVLYAGQVASRPVISVLHADGLRTTYEPVRPGVRAGDVVQPGDPLGALLAGHPGCPAAACLHWGLRRGDSYLDPLALLGLGQVRLLPVGDPAETNNGYG